MSSKEIKEKIIEDINKLPENSLKEIMDFISAKVLNASIINDSTIDNSEEAQQLFSEDPLLRLIGIFDAEPFADKIDDELYGTLK